MVGLRRMDEKGEIFDQINTGTVSKATPRKLQRDGVGSIWFSRTPKYHLDQNRPTQWGAADAESEVLSVENTEFKGSPGKT